MFFGLSIWENPIGAMQEHINRFYQVEPLSKAKIVKHPKNP